MTIEYGPEEGIHNELGEKNFFVWVVILFHKYDKFLGV